MKAVRKLGVLLILTCILIVSTGMTVVHANEMRSVSIYSKSATLTIASDGTATVKASVMGKVGVTSTSVVATLQRETSSGWDDVVTWEASNASRRTTISETYQVSRGTYRVVATVTADSESMTVTSTTETY
ncbi:MAG: hypothetical protein E7261_06105 [Lachnospiraceae bacterium]|nr:hypothetical protein [Lachnospiraceae bacterium]